jgi:PKD repeat protein
MTIQRKSIAMTGNVTTKQDFSNSRETETLLSTNLPTSNAKTLRFNQLLTFLIFLLTPFLLNAQSFQIVGDSNACADAIQNYSATPNGNYQYVWGATGGTLVSSNGNKGDIKWSNAGSGKVTLAVYDSAGTVLLDTVSLNTQIHYIPEPTIIPEIDHACKVYEPKEGGRVGIGLDSTSCNVVCEGEVVRYSVDSYFNNFTFNWDVQGDYLGHGSTSSSSFQVEWGSAPGYGSVNVEVISPEGCIGTAEICVEIVSKPEADFDVNPGPTVCVDSEVQFTDQSIDAEYWEWDFGDGTGISIDQNPTHTYTQTGVYTVKLKVENECGCVDSAVFDLEVLPAPDLELYCISPVCAGDQSSYTILNNGPDSLGCAEYDISASNGQVNGYDPSSQTFNVDWGSNAGPQELIRIIGPDCFQCPIYFSIPVVNPDNARIEGKDTVCVGEQVEYDFPLWPGTDYDWSISPTGAGTVIGVNGNDKLLVEWNNLATNGASITLEYSHPMLGDCSAGIDEFNVIALPEYSLSGPEKLCESDPQGEYEILSSISGTGNFDYIVTDQQTGNPVSTGSFTGPSSNISFPGPGNYIIKTANTSGDYCEADAYYSVKVFEQPTTPDSNFIAGDRVVCPGVPYGYGYSDEVPQEYYLKWETAGGNPDSSSANPVTVIWDGSPGMELVARYVAKDEPGCVSDSVTVSINTQDLSQADITGPDTTCNNSFRTYQDLGNGDLYQWRIQPSNAGSVTSGQGSDAVDIQWNNYVGQATIYVDRTVCDTTITDVQVVELEPVQQVSIVSADSLCQNQAETFTAANSSGAQSFNWDFSPFGTSNQASPQVTYEDSGSFTVNLEVNFPGCQVPSTDQKVIYVRPAPVAYVSTPDPLGFCLNPTLYATMQGTGSGTNTFEWYKTGSGFTGNTGSTFQPTSTGSYYVIGTSSTMFCTATSNTINVSACDTSGSGGCDYSDTIQYSTSNLGCGDYQISASINNGTIERIIINENGNHVFNQNTVNYTFDEAGFYQAAIEARVVNNAGTDSCFLRKTFQFEVPLVADFSYGISCGPGNTYTFDFLNTSSYTPGNAITTTQWSTGSGTFSTNYDATEDFTSGSTQTITLVVDNGTSSCTTQQVINVPNKPNALFTPDQPACVEQAMAFTDLSSGNIKSWYWEYDDQSFTDAYINGSSFFTYDQATGFAGNSVSLTLEGEYGCTSQYDTSVIVNPNPISGITITNNGNQLNCPGTCVQLNVSSTLSNLDYLWSNLETSQQIDICQTGSYSVTAVDQGTGCIAYSQGATHIGFFSLPTPVILGDSVMCLQETYTLRGNVGDAYDYKWLSAGGTVISTQPNYDFFTGFVPTTSYIDLVIEDPINGCSDTGRFHYSVVPPTNPQITSTSPAPLCEGEGVELDYTIGNPPIAYYQWSSGQNIVANQPGPYRFTAYDQFGCKAEDIIDVGEKPYVDNFMCGCYEFCIEDGFELEGIPGDYSDYVWLVDGHPFVTGSGSVSPFDQWIIGTHNYQLAVATGNGCYDTTCVSEITMTICDGDEPCDAYPCDDCDEYVEIVPISCIEDDDGNKTYTLTTYINVPQDMFVVYAIGPNGNQIPLSGPSFIPQNQYIPLDVEITPYGQFPYCYTLYLFNPANQTLCPVEICIEEQDISSLPCTSGKRDISSGIDDNGYDELKIYPNPAKSQLFVNYSNDGHKPPKEVVIYNATGSVVYRGVPQNSTGTLKVNTSNWPVGMYVVHVISQTDYTQVRKVTITR